MKKIILSLAAVSTLLSLNTSLTKANADTNINYLNNAYQVCEVQSELKNLYLGDSIYNYSVGTIRQNKSIRILNPTTNKLTLYFNFQEDVSSYNVSPYGSFLLTIKNDEGTNLIDIGEQFRTLSELKENLERDDNIKFYYSNNEVHIEIDTTDFGDYLTICGDDTQSTYDHFEFSFSQNLATLNKFMAYDGNYESFIFNPPTIGFGANSQQIYTNLSEVTYVVNYDNRLDLEQIKSEIIAFDYFDNEQITPEVVLDEYTQAIEDNELGTFKVKLKATDKAGNESILNLNLQIKDLTAPVITGNEHIRISYTDLPSNKLVDITKYIYGMDNYDGKITLSEEYKTITPEMFDTKEIEVAISDSSGNTTTKTINLEIYDIISPDLIGNKNIELFQYQVNSKDDIVNFFTIKEDGSGIKTIKTTSTNFDPTKPGTYRVKIELIDNYGNQGVFNINITVKDGVGPVFFVNVSSLTVSTSEYKDANAVMTQLMDEGKVSKTSYTECKYITTSYKENYEKEGTYDTQIVCYDEEGNVDYYLVKLEVKKDSSSNFFTRFYNSLIKFFKTLFADFKSFFTKIISFLKK